ncbi:nucleotidyl transferase AbiEii/AbiGii toxin family protein [Mangrovimonas sp. AS39]|uniref:nucleotidyl transferase AbiEii/AbiGii toxin family protein n=1 Tax=Mangrovimonas futianensis TaxID=2895523 RepID=UPI001E392FED|nr:nucleotidyl transferase AbiEii/AbiGii toxin family protein [Mangrovimonas futianensis]MCF1190103.1 nucleotidyl transferase AbiEii/AbiGii toxin family protein [Mangrovimonas futianensis]MCF1194146.1 nucleotidyl transferase AbiEii/AbiGii toxin family protein [Mangrovimonas futianensis]
MAAQEFYKLKETEKVEVFTAVAQQKGLPVYAVEKDWWVVQTLDIIFSQLEVAEHLLFKGGTSLSKAWHLIQRFSEDIDLALNREYLGFDGGLISKSQVKKLREKSFEFVTSTFYEALQKAFTEKGYTDVTFDFENLGDGDQDPVSILIYYPAVTEHSEYVLPRVKVELGSRSLKDPFTNCDIVSFVGEQFPKQPFADTAINVPCVNPERTYLEKLFLLHEEFKKPNDKIRVERLSRHLYDISKIYNSEHKDKAYDQELIVSIIEHRERFNGMRGVDYATLYPPNLNPIPPDDFIKAWEDDYKTMQTNMIPEDSPSFTDLLETVKKATQEYNALKFE